MPPKAKFTREQVIDAAFQLVRTEGPQALTARALGQQLGSSARPIFTLFDGMEQVQQAVFEAAKAEYQSRVLAQLAPGEEFLQMGMAYVQFAVQEPKLFRLLFMTEQAAPPTMEQIFAVNPASYCAIRNALQIGFSLNQAQAEQLLRHLWLYTHGMAVLAATRSCMFEQEQLRDLLYDAGVAFVTHLKNER